MYFSYEVVNIKLLKKQPKWYYDLNPSGTVPCLQLDDGRVVYDSLTLAEYLDNAFPENKLTPSDPYVNAQHKMLMEHFTSKVWVHFFKLYRGDSTVVPILTEGFEFIEKKMNSDKFLGGLEKKFHSN